jgi:hypothetical protein
MTSAAIHATPEGVGLLLLGESGCPEATMQSPTAEQARTVMIRARGRRDVTRLTLEISISMQLLYGGGRSMDEIARRFYTRSQCSRPLTSGDLPIIRAEVRVCRTTAPAKRWPRTA